MIRVYVCMIETCLIAVEVHKKREGQKEREREQKRKKVWSEMQVILKSNMNKLRK